MARRKAQNAGVRAIFDPAGAIRCRVVTPSGNEYDIRPREVFKIASEDVDWFFHEWQWEHRQRLSREEEYRPRQAQFDNGKATLAAGGGRAVNRPAFDNGEATLAASVTESVERPQFTNGELKQAKEEPEPEAAAEPESEEENEPVPVTVAEGDDEDKE